MVVMRAPCEIQSVITTSFRKSRTSNFISFSRWPALGINIIGINTSVHRGKRDLNFFCCKTSFTFYSGNQFHPLDWTVFCILLMVFLKRIIIQCSVRYYVTKNVCGFSNYCSRKPDCIVTTKPMNGLNHDYNMNFLISRCECYYSPRKRRIWYSKRELFHAHLPFWGHMVHFNDGNCCLTIPVVKGHCACGAHTFNFAAFAFITHEIIWRRSHVP